MCVQLDCIVRACVHFCAANMSVRVCVCVPLDCMFVSLCVRLCATRLYILELVYASGCVPLDCMFVSFSVRAYVRVCAFVART